MSYQVLARKWRPRKFAELVGQEHVVRALTNALDSGRMHHAYLFTGTRGVGKTTIARIFAKSLNCERGESADPCGECSVCTAVDAGRFVDLLEIDAASNTGVDDVREVIENAQYAPSRGRFKVYLVDEVHMLSKPAFNALLKTLEEPPPHVKFLLATTDPQKLPVTVLSRCLKFNLKRLLPEQISGQMRHILAAEGIEYDDEAIGELAHGADGSLRDGLSLLDQAIAYGGGALRAADVRAMLGSVERGQVLGVIEALAAGDGAALMGEADRIASYSPDFAGVLDDLATVLHRIQLIQLIPGYREEEGDAGLAEIANRLAPEDVQLYYQIATTSRRELPLAPDARIGFEMALLRMFAFRPAEAGQGAAPSAPRAVAPASARAAMPAPSPAPVAPSRAPAPAAAPVASAPAPAPAPSRPAPAAPPVAAPVAAPPAPVAPQGPLVLGANGLPDWHEVIERANLRGPIGQLAQNSSLRELDGEGMVLALQPSHMHLAVEPLTSQMEEKVSQALGRRIRIRFIADHGNLGTPAERRAQAQVDAQANAVASMESDPFVRTLKREFDARVIPQSIKPVEPGT
ncbi:DNA polymerase III, subunit gamma and tau [Luteibacter rhizovicinus DSM 16549]|uniref:DNA polymerase III subunit gamma/tau n=1 Tax=Luteibacter rhizovicinus DSM 16549 TaxID=1440763 RepID=A0A0G9H898_9GAMM|nr:DNA polymerase III subunit gamma/tau [Luteibacter rhizovicinus]APG06231.1 DNA polymerase III, subunit gamma and tau [Luteibacter rhizovicinus DSM 16549]KLD65651.1 DNA polymerase III subunit gamma/tau [Luteibacter rhizovicinus DSM 16549]KLD75607.1 DNA polymerase III subunit gamma/tau [Xanthomonas hyacinthi DSM 19077]